MSPRTEKQFEDIRQNKIRLIKESALELFATNGFKSTSISQIAKHAGISKGLLYNYFKSKEELLLDILNEGFDELVALYDINKDGTLEPHEMEYFLNEAFRVLEEKREFYRLYFQAALQPSVFQHLDKKLEEIVRPLTLMTIRYFESMGFENPQAEAMIFGAIMDGLSFDYVMKPDLFPINVVRDELIRRYCHVKKDPKTSSD